MKFHDELLKQLKRDKSLPLEYLSIKFKLSVDLLSSILLESDDFKIIGNELELKGIGETRCISCGNKTDSSKIDSFRYEIPKNIFNDYHIISSYISDGKVLGHKSCFEDLGLFFRVDDAPSSLSCGSCSSFIGSWVDGDGVEEICYKLNDFYVGNRGGIADNKPCNFYNVMPLFNFNDKSVYDRLVSDWNSVSNLVQLKVEKNQSKLVELLENARLIEKKNFK